MDEITLLQTLPQVFQERRDTLQSQVWLQDLTLRKGETLLVEADSGTGKSSLCSFLFGYRMDYTGQILFDKRDIRTLRTSDWVRLRRQSLSLLWQELRLFPELTAWENVQIKNRLLHFQSDQQLTQWFELLGIADKRDTLAGHMSYGQQQRVALIRSLCQPFDFLLADEPISHLDDRNAHLMAQILEQEARRQGAGVLVTSIGKQLPLNYTKTLKL